MLKTIEVSGKTEDEAIQSALEQLGMSRDDVSIEIVERAKSGFLGLGGAKAVVRVTYEADERDEPGEIVSDDASKTELVDSFLKGLLVRMEFDAVPEITETDNGISVVLTGESPGLLIGRRGETLDAIQHLTNYVVNRSGGRVRVSVDAENYRLRRDEALVRLAEKTAAKTVKYRRNMTLEPMSSYERHVIHTALQEFDGVTTYSVGNEPNRRVVVSCERRDGSAAPRQAGPAPAARTAPPRSAPSAPPRPAPSAPPQGGSSPTTSQSREWR